MSEDTPVRVRLKHCAEAHYPHADLMIEAAAEIERLEAEVERLRGCLRERPNTFLIAHEDGDKQRLSRALSAAHDVVRDCVALLSGDISGPAQVDGILREARELVGDELR